MIDHSRDQDTLIIGTILPPNKIRAVEYITLNFHINAIEMWHSNNNAIHNNSRTLIDTGSYIIHKLQLLTFKMDGFWPICIRNLSTFLNDCKKYCKKSVLCPDFILAAVCYELTSATTSFYVCNYWIQLEIIYKTHCIS